MLVRALLCLSLAWSASVCSAEEVVYLRNGFSIHVDSHVQQDGKLQFQMGSGTIELAAENILRIEASNLPVAKVAPVSQTPPEDLLAVLTEAANAEGVDPAFVRSVAKIESDYRQQAISKKGALGLMQLMPLTAKDLGVDATQARENALGGAKYLRDLLVAYHYNSALALAAYNAGPGAIKKYGGIPPYSETRGYVLKVTREYDRQVMQAAKAKQGSASATHTPTSKD